MILPDEQVRIKIYRDEPDMTMQVQGQLKARKIPCPQCNGEGCPECNGHGVFLQPVGLIIRSRIKVPLSGGRKKYRG